MRVFKLEVVSLPDACAAWDRDQRRATVRGNGAALTHIVDG